MIHIQSNTERTRPFHFESACVMYGAIEKELPYRLTSYEEVASGKYDMVIPTSLFVGSTDFMRLVFSRVGLEDVRLPMNSNRSSEIITLDEAHQRVKDGSSLFIKPVEIKLFSGLVLDGVKHSCLMDKPGDTLVMAYKPFEYPILSEWRMYIHRDKLIDSRNYSGDFKLSPDYDYVEKIIKENKNIFPCAYTIDIGILTNGDNVVVEYNDMWAIGNYGIPNNLYLHSLTNRYFEIIRMRYQ